jgi:hypothetical protein
MAAYCLNVLGAEPNFNRVHLAHPALCLGIWPIFVGGKAECPGDRLARGEEVIGDAENVPPVRPIKLGCRVYDFHRSEDFKIPSDGTAE